MNLDTTNLLVTGGAGFIGSALVEMLLARPGVRVLNLDKVTYAANPEALERFAREPNYRFARGDIRDRPLVERLLAEFRPQGLIHLAAESHVDRSIDDAAGFLQTNIMGTHVLIPPIFDGHSVKREDCMAEVIHARRAEADQDDPQALFVGIQD